MCPQGVAWHLVPLFLPRAGLLGTRRELAGIAAGDVIIAVDGAEVRRADEARALTVRIYEYGKWLEVKADARIVAWRGMA